MGYVFGAASEAKKEGLHPDLVAVLDLALKKSTIDFAIIEGLRTKARQKKLVAEGKSWTMESRHLTGHAADIVPYVDGKISWEWKHFYPMAEAVRQAAKELGVAIRWGGCWARFDDTTAPTEELVRHYVEKRKRQGKKATPDGPHFELFSKVYPDTSEG